LKAVSDGPAGIPIQKEDYKPWYPTVPNFIDRAFHAAKKAAPEVILNPEPEAED